jgi:hypothetical protein
LPDGLNNSIMVASITFHSLAGLPWINNLRSNDSQHQPDRPQKPDFFSSSVWRKFGGIDSSPSSK